MREVIPLKCLLCSEEAAVMIKAMEGCTCAKNIYQPRCWQHLARVNDTNDEFDIVEDYRKPIMEQP